MSEVISITVPDPLLDRLMTQSKATRRPIEEMVVAALRDSFPAPPANLPQGIHAELSSLESLTNEELEEVLYATDSGSPQEAASYVPGDAGDLLMLRKAYAAVLLRWRGEQVVSPELPSH